jgi:hypothetical protein
MTASVDIDGVGLSTAEAKDFLNTVADIESQVEALNAVFRGLGGTLESIGEKVDKSTGIFANAVKKQATPEELQQKEQERQQREADNMARRMANEVNGGVNALAYEQSLDKIKAQIEAVNAAQDKNLLSWYEATKSKTKLGIEWGKLQVEAKLYAAAGGGELGKIAAMTANRVMALPGQAAGAAANQITGVGRGLMGLAESTPLGNAAGGLFGLLLHGQMDADRLKAEAGEMANIVVAAGGSASSSATRFFAAFQEQAAHYFGMTRQEVQGTLKTFVDAGVSLADITEKQSAAFGEAGANVVTLTLAIDKHFEMASGSSAKNVVSLIGDYGMAVKDAGDLYAKLAFAGQSSGMGTQSFINTVMQGAGNLRQFGVGVQGVGAALLKIQERYEGMGMPKQLAGTQASMGLSQISSGISGMSTTMQSVMGERMGLGTGLEARMGFRDGLQRLSGGGDDAFLGQTVSQLYKMAMEAGGGDKTQARFFLEQQGYGLEGSRAIMSVGTDLEKGVKLNELSIESQKNIRDAFKTEGQKTSDMAKNQYTIMKGMAEMGQGLLQIVTNLVAYGIVFFKGMPTLLMGNEDEKKATLAMMNSFTKEMTSGAGKVGHGAMTVAKGVYGLMGPIIRPLEDALNWNPYSHEVNADRIRIIAAGDKAEKEINAANPISKLGGEISKAGMKLQGEGSTVASAVGDAGVLVGGLATGVGRLASAVAAGLGGDDAVKHARDNAMNLEKADIEREQQAQRDKKIAADNANNAPKPPKTKVLSVVVKPAYADRGTMP